MAEGGADAICIETMWSVHEAAQAVRAAKENTSLPVICTFTFEPAQAGFPDHDGRHAGAARPERLFDAGADIVGANCGNGIANMIEITRQMRAAAPKTPILIQANAGLPVD